MTTRRGFLGLLAGLIAAPRAKWQDLWRPADLVYGPPTPAVFFYNTKEIIEGELLGVNFEKIVIGAYADYWPPPEDTDA